MLPDDALALLRSRFPDEPLAGLTPTSGGFSHPSALLSLGPQRCVAKAAELPPKRADLRRETRVLTLLRDMGLPVPAPVALLEDERWTVELLGALPGINGIGFYERPTPQLEALAHTLGALLARVHRLPLAPPDDQDLDLGARLGAIHAALPALDLPGDVRAPLDAAFAALPREPARPSLVHGDAGLHNLLWHEGRVALLDWEWAGFGDPLFDLAWVRWTLRWRQAPESIWPAVLDGYGDGPAADTSDAPTLDALALVQMAALLTRVAVIPAARAEWVRRVRWTLS
jgi:aminoglycoside phosphotransferase (APT) family kinase protein